MNNNHWIDEIEEPRTDMSGNIKKTNRMKNKGWQGQERTLIWGGAALILILLLVLLFRGCGASPGADIRELRSRVASLEDKLVRFESERAQEQAVSRDFDRSEDFQVLVHRLDTLSKKVQSLENKIPERPTGSSPEKTPSSEQTRESDTAFLREQTYTVKPGDTLYSISRKHEVSVDNLRAWNELGQNGVIYPGQELQIAPQSDQ